MPQSIDDYLDDARRTLERADVSDLDALVDSGALLVDTRPAAQRERDGELPGAIVIERNILEWRLDPQSEDRIDEASYDRKVIIVCNEGYASSLAAATLRELGVDATDLVGGYQAWRGRRNDD
jgi:rhodanese-related sulfurtransferase